METSSPFDPRAEGLFFDWLARRDAGENADFEDLCRTHPELAGDLRALRESWDNVSGVLARFGAQASLSARLREQFGPDVDPEIELDREAKKESSATSSRLVERLREAGTRGTRYQLLGEVARGGMGAILRVWDDDLRRALAMKVVLGRDDTPSGQTPDVDPRTLGRFLEEAQITGQLDHPGIVPVHELGLGADGRVYFTMRLVKGVDLRTIFEHVLDGTDGWNRVRALGVLLKVCEAMSYAHSKGVIHRDLKPANVMVGKFGEVYVMDWGLARVLGRADKHDLRIKPQPSSQSVVKTERRERRDESPDSPLVTMDGDVVGTPSYMPPEQAKGQLDRLGAHSDVYSLGAMLYQLIAGEMPYVPRDARVSQHTVLMRVIEGPPKALHELAPRAPAELVAICDKAMAREIVERYGNTRELAEDLRAYDEGRVVRAYETGTWAETRKWVQRNKTLATSLAAAVLILIAGVATSSMFAVEATTLKNAAVARTDAVWAIQELVDFRRKSNDWEFARSLERPAHEWWLETARELVDGRAEDTVHDLKRRPGLQDHQRLLAEVRRVSMSTRDEHARAGGRLIWKREDNESRWWDEQLTQLVTDLIALRDRITAAEQSVDTAQVRELWNAAITAIAVHPKYGGLKLTPQLDLLPIGPDPSSTLWEFAHVPTGEPARRGADRKLALMPETGLVFVLLPSGRVPVEDRRERGPLNAIDLIPFFISKYEMTQAQWARIPLAWTGRFWRSKGPLEPANCVSWADCQARLERAGSWLHLPSEAQWEYACRAGTTTPWWTGATEDSLRGAANVVFDSEDKTVGSVVSVGMLRANLFGLHDVQGNVGEWCQDTFNDQDMQNEHVGARVDDGLREESDAFLRAIRGANCDDEASYAQSAYRYCNHPDARYYAFGLRPVRRVTP